MSGGIIALIVVGALLAVLLAGAFAFRRIQVYRRAKRRENNYGAGAVPDAPFPFTNVSESDMKGAQSVRDFGRQPSITSQRTEKPLPSVAPDFYPVDLNADAYGRPAYNDGMSGPYPMMGPGAYGYGQNRIASPAPPQPQRMMSPAPVPTYARAPSPVNPYPNHPQMLTPAAPPAATLAVPGASLSVPQVSGKKRVIQTFQPSLPDELDIRDGDWVVVVHAYDDGWGLCECNGRRGVVPLECLDLGKPDFRASRRLSSLSAIRQ